MSTTSLLIENIIHQSSARGAERWFIDVLITQPDGTSRRDVLTVGDTLEISQPVPVTIAVKKRPEQVSA